MSGYLLRAPSKIRSHFVTIAYMGRSQGVDQIYPSRLLSAGGVLHFPLVGRGPAFSLVVIFHPSYAATRRIGVCLSPFSKVVAYHSAQEGVRCNGAFWRVVITLFFGPEPGWGKPISSASRINQPDLDPDGIRASSNSNIHTLQS